MTSLRYYDPKKTGKELGQIVLTQDGKVKKGTKKDYNYLRCLSGCLARCEAPPSPGGQGKERGECLQDCRDDCCDTYEQCTYVIRDSATGR